MIDGISVSNLTPSVIAGIAVLAVLLGILVPRYIYRDKVQEAKDWRKAYEAEREARVTSDAQTRELLELAKTTHNIIVALFGSTSDRSRQSGGPHVVQTPTGK